MSNARCRRLSNPGVSTTFQVFRSGLIYKAFLTIVFGCDVNFKLISNTWRCELPVVISPAGINTEIVESGKNDFLALNYEIWINPIEKIISIF